jgi:RHS repeat-associated protein
VVFRSVQHDGAGNITAIGTQAFAYDVRGRLVSAAMTRSDQPGSQQFTYSYDVMGNMISRTAVTSTAILTPASIATNRLTANGAAYDVAGNLTSIQPSGQPYTYTHVYDPLNALQKTSVTASPTTPRYHIYTAGDERLWTFDGAADESRWTLRDLSGKVLRDFTFDWVAGEQRWRLSRDYIYRDGLLLAAITPTETLHFSLDHLGSTRIVTDASRNRVGLHYYLPFGEEWLVNPQASDSEPLKFTGHERDTDPAGGTAPLDYMHARYYGGRTGRFLSVDPVLDSVEPSMPQSWNRYSYVMNTPLNLADPTGKCGESPDFVGPTEPCDFGYALEIEVGAENQTEWEFGKWYVDETPAEMTFFGPLPFMPADPWQMAAMYEAECNPPEPLITTGFPPFVGPIRRPGVTEPTLPPKTISKNGPITFEHNYRSNDHPPAHAHVRGGGDPTRILPNGGPYPGDAPMTAAQRAAFEANKSLIRRAINKIGRWLDYHGF